VDIYDENLHLNEGNMVILPSNKPHALKGTTRFKMILTMIRAG
jgi:quercetin dioxygenase-like cupin family protein